MEKWCPIQDFPDYSVSDHGRVRNDREDRILAIVRNQQGVAYVGITADRKQYKRGVALLVANAFIPRPNPRFDTPINLDGDRSNNHINNLAWRPRWFAVRYHLQFHREHTIKFVVPIEDTTTGERFRNSWEACLKYGLIERDLVLAITNQTFVFPTYQVFRVVRE